MSRNLALTRMRLLAEGLKFQAAVWRKYEVPEAEWISYFASRLITLADELEGMSEADFAATQAGRPYRNLPPSAAGVPERNDVREDAEAYEERADTARSIWGKPTGWPGKDAD
jgi:hypothetical protein